VKIFLLNKMGEVKNTSVRNIWINGFTSLKKTNNTAQIIPMPIPVTAQGIIDTGIIINAIDQSSFRNANSDNAAVIENKSSKLETIHLLSGNAKGETYIFLRSHSPPTIDSIALITTFSKYLQGTSAAKRKTA